MSSSSSTTTIPARLRITFTVLDVQRAAPTRAPPTRSSPRGTCVRPETWSGFWKRRGRLSTPNCFSWWTQIVVEEAVAGCVTVAAAPTTLTSCTRRSVIAACEAVGAAAVKTIAAASAATTGEMETAPPPPPHPPSGVGITGIVTTPALISIRITAATLVTTPMADPSQVQAECPASLTFSSASRPLLLLLLLHRGGHNLWWLSSLLLPSHRWWASWGNSLTPLLLHHLPLLALHLPEAKNMKMSIIYLLGVITV